MESVKLGIKDESIINLFKEKKCEKIQGVPKKCALFKFGTGSKWRIENFTWLRYMLIVGGPPKHYSTF